MDKKGFFSFFFFYLVLKRCQRKLNPPFPLFNSSKSSFLRLNVSQEAFNRICCLVNCAYQKCSVQFSHSVRSDSLRSHRLQHSRLPCPSPILRACSNSCPSSTDAIQPSHPLSSPFSPAFNLSQNQGLFQWVTSLHQVTKVLELQLQHQSFQRIFRIEFL